MTVQAVLFSELSIRRDAILILLAAKNQKIILFSFWRRLQFYYNSTTMNQIYFQNCMWLCMTLYLLTYYLKVLTYFWFLFSFFVFSLFLFSFFFVKNQIQTTFFCKKILRIFLPPPNECYVVFLISKHLKKKKKGQQISPKKTQNKHQISSQSIISRWTKKKRWENVLMNAIYNE